MEYEYKTEFCDGVSYLRKFLNKNKIPKEKIISVFRNENGVVELLYIEDKEKEE